MRKGSVIAPVSRIVIPYLVVGSLWILFSDRLLLTEMGDPSKLMLISTAKGWLYVLITGILLLSLVYREVSKQASLEAMLRKGLLEKDALLSELNHRVMNNLQVLTSILNLESEKGLAREAGEMNARMRARIRAMGIAQERLYESAGFGRIDLGAYLRALWDALVEIYGVERARASFDVIDARAGPDEAVPFGLFASEAISNALRHGAEPDGIVEASIRLAGAGGTSFEFSIRDSGSGMREGAQGLGTRLMDALAAQLNGTVLRNSDGGTRVTLKFSLPESRDA